MPAQGVPTHSHSGCVLAYEFPQQHRTRGGGIDPHEAALYRQVLKRRADDEGFRPGKYRFKIKRGRPHPDEHKITLTGNPIPDTMRRAAEWSAERHGFRKPKERVGPFRPKLP